MKFLENLKKRWEVKSFKDVVVILAVFTCTGFTSLFIKKPLFALLGIKKLEPQWLNIIVYVISVLIFYNILLLIFGFLFGKFRFFLDFEKRFFGKIFYISIKKKQ